MKKKIIIIAGGGTGGHVYPALSIADAICQMDTTYKVLFVGTQRGLESRVIPESSHQIKFINVGMFNKNVSLLIRLKTLFFLPISLLQSFWILLRARPVVVLGVGGYASVPIVFIASLLGIKSFLWEPNAHPGMANRFLSKYVKKSLVVFEETKKFFKSKEIIKVGMPIRAPFEAGSKLEKSSSHGFRVFIFGGSQGARRINEVVGEMILSMGDQLNEFEFIHQTGPKDYSMVTSRYQALSQDQLKRIQVFEYIEDMPEKYQWADLVVCRSGTGSLSELAAMGKACVLIPYPYAADNHQQKNAEALLSQSAAEMILQKNLFPETLLKKIVTFKEDISFKKECEDKIKTFHTPKAADGIAKILLQ